MPAESPTIDEKSVAQTQASKATASRRPRGSVSSFGSRVEKHGTKRRGAQEPASASHLGIAQKSI